MQKAALITALVVNHTNKHLQSSQVQEIYELVRKARRSAHGAIARLAAHKVAWFLSEKTNSTRLSHSPIWCMVRVNIAAIVRRD